jgi:glycerophosphoryl diester phosphodiesterase
MKLFKDMGRDFRYTTIMRAPLVIAHRGDSSNALENSLEAVRLALSIPVDMIEIDVRKSADDVLYVMHDRETERTADKNVNIEGATSHEIAKIRLKNGEPIPTLNDIFRIVAGSVGLNLEIKSDGAGAVFAKRFFQYRYSGYVLVSSFKEPEVIFARGVMLDLPVSMIFDEFTPKNVPAYRARGYKIVSLKKKTVTRDLVAACHEQGIQVYVWTVDEEAQMRKYISWGVDGIYSNRPGILKKLLASSEL